MYIALKLYTCIPLCSTYILRNVHRNKNVSVHRTCPKTLIQIINIAIGRDENIIALVFKTLFRIVMAVLH